MDSTAVKPIQDEASLNAWLLTDAAALHVLFLYADFHAPSRPGGQMDTVVNTLASIHQTVKFGKMDAEAVADVSEQFDINAVPTFLFFKNKSSMGRLEGADSLELTRRVEQLKSAQAPAESSGTAVKSISALAKQLEQVCCADAFICSCLYLHSWSDCSSSVPATLWCL